MNEYSEWSHIIKAFAYDADKARKEKEYNISQRPINDKKQQTLGEFKEFEEDSIMMNVKTIKRDEQGNIGMTGTFTKGGKGQTKESRGTQNTYQPTQPTQVLNPTAPTGGVTPMGNDKGPMKQLNDNIINKNKRQVQDIFNVGPNAVNNSTGLSNKTQVERLEMNKHIVQGIGGKSHNPYEAELKTRDPDRKDKGPMGRLTSSVGSFFGLEGEAPVGTGVDLQVMFQSNNPYKKSEPIEVTQNEDDTMDKKENKKLITSEKKTCN